MDDFDEDFDGDDDEDDEPDDDGSDFDLDGESEDDDDEAFDVDMSEDESSEEEEEEDFSESESPVKKKRKAPAKAKAPVPPSTTNGRRKTTVNTTSTVTKSSAPKDLSAADVLGGAGPEQYDARERLKFPFMQPEHIRDAKGGVRTIQSTIRRRFSSRRVFRSFATPTARSGPCRPVRRNGGDSRRKISTLCSCSRWASFTRCMKWTPTSAFESWD